jgi:hypothetical protein
MPTRAGTGTDPPTGLWHAAPVTSSRRLVSSGSPLEPEIGFSRAMRSGPCICVAGTASITGGGGTAAPGDVYAQSVRCLDIAEQALQEAGGSLADVGPDPGDAHRYQAMAAGRPRASAAICSSAAGTAAAFR